jgi:hypothetical protein
LLGFAYGTGDILRADAERDQLPVRRLQLAVLLAGAVHEFQQQEVDETPGVYTG